MLLSANAFEWLGFAAIFSYSFTVSFHCIGMCGPLACSLLDRTSLAPWKSSLLYNLGRGTSYAAAGAVASGLAIQISDVWSPLTEVLSITLGGLVCAWALLCLFRLRVRIPRLGSGQTLRWVQQRFASLPPTMACFLFGAITLFLPCMTLHPLLFMSAAQKSPAAGAMTMLAFFSGTLPAMVSATYMPIAFRAKMDLRRFQPLGYLFLFFAGLVTILRSVLHS